MSNGRLHSGTSVWELGILFCGCVGVQGRQNAEESNLIALGFRLFEFKVI